MTGCGSAPLSGKPGSSGKTLELMVVATNTVYNGVAHHALDTLFKTPQDGLNQPESRFDVVRIAPHDFNGNAMFQAHRNVLILEVDPQVVNKVYLDYDKWSSPQVVIRITACDCASLDSMLFTHTSRLLKEFYGQEYRRMAKVFSDQPDYKINNMIKERYGFSLTVPQEFMVAKTAGNFTWLRKETKDFSLGVLIDITPAKGNDYAEAVILDRLDTMLAHHVPGSVEGSYMGTERRDFFYTRDVKIGDIDAVETRGLWRLYNDFMGGCFVCYSFPYDEGKSVATLMGFVYSPSQRNKMVMKRDLLMQVDGICRTVKFD